MRLKALDKKPTGTTAAVLVVVLLLAIIFFPLAVIWAVNTLFHTGIAYGFYEWLAVLVLSTFFNGTKVSKND